MTSDSPAIQRPEKGCVYDVTSDFWKGFCVDMPCTGWMGWPDYHTAVIIDEIDGQEVLIQCWKGWCQRFPTVVDDASVDGVNFPGGIGAEVGIYQRDPKRPHFALSDLGIIREIFAREAPPEPSAREVFRAEDIAAVDPVAPGSPGLPPVPDDWSPAARRAAQEWLYKRYTPTPQPPVAASPSGADGVLGGLSLPTLDFIAPGFDLRDQWFPAPGLVKKANLKVKFSLSDPLHGVPIISDYETPTYWTCKWMHRSDYLKVWYPKWLAENEPGSKSSDPPLFDPYEFRLDFSVGGVKYKWYSGSTIEKVS
jgi:hypothetical protein